jgi:hypothetical protein
MGLVTNKHISSEDVVFDRFSGEEKEQVFAMGFVPDDKYLVEDPSSDE